MKRKLIAACMSALCSMSAFAEGQGSLEGLIQRINPRVHLGIVAVDLNTGETLYNKNAKQLFIPASNMKLFSEAAALMALGPEYRYKNQLSTNARHIQQGVLNGNLYLILKGDPSFTREDLRELIASLKEWKISTIRGSVFIDSAFTGVTTYPPGWLKADMSYSYGAPIAPVMIDSNRLSITVNPGSREGELAIVEVDDGGGVIDVNNHATTKLNAKGCGVGAGLDNENRLTINGCIGKGQWAEQQRIAIRNPLLYAQGLIANELVKEGIIIEGNVQLGKAPAGSMILATQYSKPISQLMADTMKPSDNLYADSLYLHTAALLNGAPVNWDQAQPIIKKFLEQRTGIDFSNAVFSDGSGLSRYNLVTPNQTISLLKFLYQRFPLSYEYIAALPISGRDGTLQKRFRIPSQQGLVRAKTGTMTGVNGLSGYLYAANGHTIAFAVYTNRVPGKKHSGPGRPVIDAIISYWLKNSPKSNQVAKTSQQQVKFRRNVTQGELQKRHQARWRGLESAVKAVLRGQAVGIVYRNDQLILQDKQADAKKVWAALKTINSKYHFAVAVNAQQLPFSARGSKPMLLWVQNASADKNAKRTWIIREAVS